jgi:hypothetical protein
MDKILLQSQIKLRADELQYQCNVLSKQMSNAEFFDNADDKSFDLEIRMLADIFDGRIRVVNSSYCIVRDTYKLDEGKYYIAKDIFTSYQGKVSSRTNSEYQYIELIHPIYKVNSNQVAGAIIATSSTQALIDSIDSQKTNLQVIGLVVWLILLVVAFFF